MKTPDEIKKGLECCTIPLCAECPYDSEPSCVVKNEEALAYIQRLEAEAPKWISVEERLPSNHHRVLTYRKKLGGTGGHVQIETYDISITGRYSWSYDEYSWKTVVTHWMPLPEPPEVEE